MPELPRTRFDRSDMEALAAILRSDLDTFVRITREPEFNGDRFAAFAADHQLAGFIHATIEGTAAQATLPARARERLSGAFVRQWATNERLAQELRELTQAFDSAGCPFVLLKGLHLAIAYCGGADRRGMSDLDILVRKSDRARAVTLLSQRGYAPCSRALLGWRVASRFTHAGEFERNGIPLDLHWALVNHPSYRIDYAAVWRRRRQFDAEGAPVQVLDDEHALTFQLLAIAKDIELGTVTLKAFADLFAITRSFDAKLAWEPFFAARANEHTARTSVAVLSLMLAIVGAVGCFPRLDVCLQRDASPPAPPQLVERLASRQLSLRDRLWAMSLYEASMMAAASWWAVSLPFRIAAHRMPRASRKAR